MGSNIGFREKLNRVGAELELLSDRARICLFLSFALPALVLIKHSMHNVPQHTIVKQQVVKFNRFSIHEDEYVRPKGWPSPNELFRVEAFQREIVVCSGDIWYTASVCDNTGMCQVTGVAKRYDASITKSILNPVMKSINGEIIKTQHGRMIWVDDNHGLTYDAFRAFFEVNPKHASTIKDILVDDCKNEKRLPIPVDYRLKTFNGKIVMIISQFYSKIKIPWLTTYLRHHLKIGVDYIAIYSAFTPEDPFRKSLNNLLKQKWLHGRVIQFDFFEMSMLDSWSRAQAAMLNHAVTVFYGATLMSMDLDEVTIPMKHTTIVPMVREYNKKYGRWAAHFHPYLAEPEEITKQLGEKFDKDFNFTGLLDRSSPCLLPAWDPYRCRAKWIIHALDIETVQIHRFRLRTPIHQESWLDEKKAIEVHLRGVQVHEDFARREKVQSKDKPNDLEYEYLDAYDRDIQDREQLYMDDETDYFSG